MCIAKHVEDHVSSDNEVILHYQHRPQRGTLAFILGYSCNIVKEDIHGAKTEVCVCETYSDKVHFLTVLHEAPHFRSHLLPHSPEVLQYTKMLKCLIYLRKIGRKRSKDRE